MNMKGGARSDFPTNCLHPSSHRLWSYLPRSNFINAFRIARMNALQLSREKASGEKKDVS